MGKYNEGLVRSLAAEAAAEMSSQSTDTPASTAMPNRRHVWVIGPQQDPGPHAGLVITWQRRNDGDWYAWTTWYSEAANCLVQEWLHSSALTPL